MKFKTKIVIFSLLILLLSISAASAHENIIADGNDAISDDVISVNHLDDVLDDDSDDWDDSSDDLDDDWDDSSDDLDDDDWDDDSADGLDDSPDVLVDDDWDGDSDDWDDDDWDDDWDDDSDDWDDDSDDWDDDSDDWDDDWDDDWYDDGVYETWDGNYTNSSIKIYKSISYNRGEPLIAYKTTSSLDNMTYADSESEDDCEDICDDDSQEGFGFEDSHSFMTSCPGASASSEGPDVLSQNYGSVSKSINQGQNLLDDEKENNVNVTDDKDYDTMAFSSDNDLDVLGLLVSLLLCIILLI